MRIAVIGSWRDSDRAKEIDAFLASIGEHRV